jgi:hypothetical protein
MTRARRTAPATVLLPHPFDAFERQFQMPVILQGAAVEMHRANGISATSKPLPEHRF